LSISSLVIDRFKKITGTFCGRYITSPHHKHMHAYFIHISHGSVETHLWYDGLYANCLQNMSVKEFENRSIIGKDMDKSKVPLFFWPTLHYAVAHWDKWFRVEYQLLVIMVQCFLCVIIGLFLFNISGYFDNYSLISFVAIIIIIISRATNVCRTHLILWKISIVNICQRTCPRKFALDFSTSTLTAFCRHCMNAFCSELQWNRTPVMKTMQTTLTTRALFF